VTAFHIPESLQILKVKNMKRFLINLLVISPALILGCFVWKYGVNVPYMDEWDTPGLVIASQDNLTWLHWLGQHNESRKLFPRLLLLPLANLTNWNIKAEMLITFLLACLISFNIYSLSKITIKGSHVKRLVCLFLANLLIFSPMQSENWLMGLQLIAFVPIACITTSLVVIFSQTRLITKFIVSGILATVATFSFANGMVCWLVILPALILAAKKTKTTRTWIIGGWLLLFALNLAIYFHDYHKPAHHPSFTEALLNPIKAFAYFFSFIGSPLGFQDLLSSQIIGLIAVVIFGFSCFYLLAFKQNRHLIDRFFPWLLIGSYTLISGIIAAAGRVGFGLEQSLEARYITFSTYLIVALIYLLTIIGNDLAHKTLLSKAIIPLAVFFLVIYPANFVSGVDSMAQLHQQQIYGKACLMFINFFTDEDCLKNLYPDINHLQTRANQIDRLGFLQPSLATNPNLQNLTIQNDPSGSKYGFFDSLSADNNGNYITSGWAVLPRKNRPADAVILAYQTLDGSDIAFAIVKVEQKREDVAKILNTQKSLKSGWSKVFSSELVPKEAVAISAWAFDSRIGRAYKLDNTHDLE
jgi:hypothetical protein